MADEVSRAIDLLPAWVWWGPLLGYACYSMVLGFAAMRLAFLVAGLRRVEPTAPWPERARQLWPVRRGGMLTTVVVVAMLVPAGGLFAGTAGVAAGSLSVGAIGAFGALVVMFATYRRQLAPYLPGRTMTSLLHDVALRLVLAFSPLWVLAGGAAAMPGEVGVASFATFGATAVALLFFSVGGGLRVARVVGLARPAPERLAAIVAAVAGEAEAPPTSVLRGTVANAWAFPLLGELAVSEVALARLADDELAAVCAHELEHLRERGLSLARVALVVALLPLVWARPLWAGPWRSVLWIAPLVLLVGAVFVRRAGRRAEEGADRAGHAHENDDGVYARALEHLYRLNLVPAVLGGRRVHPDLYDRMVNAGVTPDYERPGPPSRRRTALTPLLPAVALWIALFGLHYALAYGLHRREPTDANVHLRMALLGGDAFDFLQLGAAAKRRGDGSRAEVMLGAAAQLDAGPDAHAHLAELYARRGDCERARYAANEAEDRTLAGDTREVVDAAWQWVAHCEMRRPPALHR